VNERCKALWKESERDLEVVERQGYETHWQLRHAGNRVRRVRAGWALLALYAFCPHSTSAWTGEGVCGRRAARGRPVRPHGGRRNCGERGCARALFRSRNGHAHERLAALARASRRGAEFVLTSLLRAAGVRPGAWRGEDGLLPPVLKHGPRSLPNGRTCG
jgi:hypothetical protein